MDIEDAFGQFPVLETERLLLRKVTMGDLEDIHAYASREEVARYVTWPVHRTLSDTKEFIHYSLRRYEQKQSAPWGIEYKENGRLIGTIEFVSWDTNNQMAEIGYVLSPDFWGKGITAEATRKIISYGFTRMELVRIQARCINENAGSARVMEKAGMSFEGLLRKGIQAKGRHWDVKMYSILKEEWEKQS